MEKHFDLSDAEFERQFSNCSLTPSLFTHTAHLRLAWVYIQKYGVEQASNKICNQILKFDNIHGKGGKFNKTVTIASVKAVAHFIEKSKSSSFIELLKEFPRLKNNFKDLLGCHYGFDIFSSYKAKTEYLEPDLLPFS